jgi:hypothetical protein
MILFIRLALIWAGRYDSALGEDAKSAFESPHCASEVSALVHHRNHGS